MLCWRKKAQNRSPSRRMKTTRVFAPAKVNLTLHVTEKRADGYHLLDSLVVFADVGDNLTISRADALTLTIDGPEAANLSADHDNLVLRSARALSDRGAWIKLTKTLPVSSGIGGGSADAAAALRGLAQLWKMSIPDEQLLQLGADVPMCLQSRSVRVRGIGEDLTPLHDLPQLPAVLVNPRVPVATPDVFRTLTQTTKPPMPDALPRFKGPIDLADWLATQRNDLQPPAIALQPVIADVLTQLEKTKDCRLARMSGSGATCFGLYPDASSAAQAAAEIGQTQPDWWVRMAKLGDQLTRATT